MFLLAPGDRQRFGVEAPAVADVAQHLHVRQEAHLDGLHALALAALAAPARRVEGEAARRVAADARFGGVRRRCGGCRPRSRCRWPGRSAASCRWASGPLRARGRRARRPCMARQPISSEAFGRLPLRRRCSCVGSLPSTTRCLRFVYSTSRATVDLPEPDTPVTTTSRPSGTRTSVLLHVVQLDALELQRAACAHRRRDAAAPDA